jgi:Ca-activated chloride channel family protein
VVYNLPMARTLYSALGVITLLSVCKISLGQTPSSGPVVSIIPRPAPTVGLNPDAVPNEHLRVDASMVLVPVHAVSATGANVTDLAAANFRVFEDGVEQKITYFSQDDAALSVGLVFDSSGSMSNKIRKSANAAAAFFKTANTGDEFFLVEFGERPKLLTPFTSDSDEVYQKIAHTKAFGRTPLIDAIHLALIQMKNARNSRKVIVILSDGGDNRSRLTRGQIKGALLESDVQLYAMGIFDAGDLLKHSREEQNGPRLLDELAEHTGGRVYTIDNLDDLESVSSQLGTALRSEYLLGYTPSNPSRDGKYRHIKVDLADSSRTQIPSISYRRGYYAPVE